MSESLNATKTASNISVARGANHPAIMIDGRPLLNRAYRGGVAFLNPETGTVIGTLPPTDKIATISIVQHVRTLGNGLQITQAELIGVENFPNGDTPVLVDPEFLKLFAAWAGEATWAGPNLDGVYTLRNILPSNGQLVQTDGGLVAARPLVTLSNLGPTRTRVAPCETCYSNRVRAHAYAMGLRDLSPAAEI